MMGSRSQQLSSLQRVTNRRLARSSSGPELALSTTKGYSGCLRLRLIAADHRIGACALLHWVAVPTAGARVLTKHNCSSTSKSPPTCTAIITGGLLHYDTHLVPQKPSRSASPLRCRNPMATLHPALYTLKSKAAQLKEPSH